MSNDLDAMLGADFDIRQQALSADVPLRATRNGYELDMPVEDIAEEMPPMDVEPTAQPEQESADPFEVLSRIGTTVYDLPNMAIRGILRAGGEAAYSAGFIDETQANTWRKMLDLSGKMAEGEGVFPIARTLGEGLAQFGAGMYGPFKAMRAMGVSRPAAALIAEGLSGAFAFNPDDPNVGNFINSFEGRPEWLKAIGDFIATDPNDTKAKNRFRNMLQDVVPSAFIESLVKVVSKVRNMDADTLIEAGAEAEERIASQMQGATLSANPVGAAGDALVAGAGKVASAMKSTEPAPVFYSAVANAVDALPMEKGNASQMRAMIAKSPEVKAEEMAWIGLDDFLKGKKSVTKQEIKDFVDANQVRIEEVVKSDDASIFEFAKGSTADEIELVVNNDEQLYQSANVINPLIEKLRNASSEGYDDVATELADALADAGIDPTMAQKMVFDDFEFNVQHGIRNQKGETKFSNYTLPGGENYREVLLRLPSKTSVELRDDGKYWINNADGSSSAFGFNTREDAERLIRDVNANSPRESRHGEFTGGHYDEPNVLAHMRLNDRTGPNGEKILFVEEIQSDWHQKGRKHGYRREGSELNEGYSIRQLTPEELEADETGMNSISNTWFALINPEGEIVRKTSSREQAIELHHMNEGDPSTKGVPDAPLKKTWHEMSFRRIARMAAEEGYDAIAFTPGKLQAERYDLSKQVSELRAQKHDDGTVSFGYIPPEGGNRRMLRTFVPDNEIEGLVGKEMAEKIRGQNQEIVDYSGVDLEVGGEGMKGFYDKMLKGYAAKWGKKFGAKVGVTQIGTKHSLRPVTDGQGNWKIYDPITGDHWMDPDTTRIPTFTSREEAASAIKGAAKGADVWTLPVTKKMRDSVLGKGVATFGAAGVAAGLNQQEARPNGN